MRESLALITYVTPSQVVGLSPTTHYYHVFNISLLLFSVGLLPTDVGPPEYNSFGPLFDCVYASVSFSALLRDSASS